MTLTGWKLTASKLIIIPQRWLLAAMCFLSILNAYTMRVILSIAITEMTIYNCNGTDHNCTESIIENQENVYDWSENVRGIILSCFYWGYAITHVPGGILAEKYGGKHLLGLGILSTAIFTILTPPVTKTCGWIGLVIVRTLMGAGEGITFPAISAMLSKWVPEDERSKLGSLAYTGSLLGSVLGNVLTGIIIQKTQSWAWPFYFFGAIAIVWCLLWNVLCFSEPEEHPYISDKELEYLKVAVRNVSKNHRKTPWKAIFSNVAIWALINAQIGHDWGFYIMVTNLPTYFKTVLNFSIQDNGLYLSLPSIVMLICSLSMGCICDQLIHNKKMTITYSRKFWTFVASFGPAFFMLFAAYTDSRIWAVAHFTIAMGLMGGFYCGMKVNALDLCPNFAGTVMGIVNGIGAITGIIAPYSAEIFTKDQTAEQWRLVFWIAAAVFMVTCTVYCLFGSGDVQEFNEAGKKDEANQSN